MTVIDDYLQKVGPAQHVELERVRAIVMKAVPEAEDTIGYGMPVLKYKHKYLIGFAPFKNHMSVFPGAEAVKELKEKLGDYVWAKGTVQFTIEKPLPEPLIKEMVEIRRRAIDKK